MFTGIITEIGRVKGIARKSLSTRLEIECKEIKKSIGLGDSVSVNGVCLSVTGKGGSLTFDIVRNTYDKTNLRRLKVQDSVNLEEALKLGDRLSGHMVSGHVDGERAVKSSGKTSRGWMLDVNIFPSDIRYLVDKCSVTVDGVSLTVGELTQFFFRIYLIPHTLGNTTLGLRKIGDYVNVEFDIIAKYARQASTAGAITEDLLKEKGFI